MAMFHDRITAPKFQRGLLRAAVPVPTPALTPETVDMLDALSCSEGVSVQSEPKCVVEALLPAESDTADFDERKTAPNDLNSLAQARALHACRELHQALEYGFALLDALDLPPLALDVIDDAIAHLDAMDAPTEDLEDEGLVEDGGDLEAVNEDGDPLDHGEHDGWRRLRRVRVARTEWPVAMAEREAQRLAVIAAVVTSPNVVRFPGRRADG